MFKKLIFIFSVFLFPLLNLDASLSSIEEPTQINQFSGDDVRIVVDIEKQRVSVFAGHSLIKEMPCSTGMPETPTPTGSFKIYEKVANAAIETDGKKITFYSISKFNGGIGFHSQIFGDHPSVQKGIQRFEERQPSSHGCVRLILSDAQWIYQNIGLGALVEVH